MNTANLETSGGSLDIRGNIPEDTRRLARSFAARYNISTTIYTDAKGDMRSYYVPDSPLAKIIRNGFTGRPLVESLRPGVHISAKNPSPAIVLHELAHAHDMGNSSRGRTIALVAQVLGGIGYAGMSMAARPSISKFAPLVATIGSIPMLYSEGKASVLATKHLMEERGNIEGIRESAKTLVPGFLTYLALPAIAAGLSLVQYKHLKSFNERGL